MPLLETHERQEGDKRDTRERQEKGQVRLERNRQTRANFDNIFDSD